MMEGDERATTSDEERLPPAEEDSTSTEQTVRRRPTSLREATKTLRWRRHRTRKPRRLRTTIASLYSPTMRRLMSEDAGSVFKGASLMSHVVQSRRPTRSSPS
jgi:hypothetical protein